MLTGQDFVIGYGPRKGGSHVGLLNWPWNIHYVTLSVTIYVQGRLVTDITEMLSFIYTALFLYTLTKIE